jgi:hypothetical protein
MRGSIQSKKVCDEAVIQSAAKPTLPQEEKEQAPERKRETEREREVLCDFARNPFSRSSGARSSRGGAAIRARHSTACAAEKELKKSSKEAVENKPLIASVKKLIEDSDGYL